MAPTRPSINPALLGGIKAGVTLHRANSGGSAGPAPVTPVDIARPVNPFLAEITVGKGNLKQTNFNLPKKKNDFMNDGSLMGALGRAMASNRKLIESDSDSNDEDSDSDGWSDGE